MKIGDYVRYNGKIAKIINIRRNETLITCGSNVVTIPESKEYVLDNNSIIYNVDKSSPNIIDLIEVGDYVNGRIVDEFIYLDKLGLIGLSELEKEDEKFIKSIVTKEMYSSVEYRVENN